MINVAVAFIIEFIIENRITRPKTRPKWICSFVFPKHFFLCNRATHKRKPSIFNAISLSCSKLWKRAEAFIGLQPVKKNKQTVIVTLSVHWWMLHWRVFQVLMVSLNIWWRPDQQWLFCVTNCKWQTKNRNVTWATFWLHRPKFKDVKWLAIKLSGGSMDGWMDWLIDWSLINSIAALFCLLHERKWRSLFHFFLFILSQGFPWRNNCAGCNIKMIDVTKFSFAASYFQ